MLILSSFLLGFIAAFYGSIAGGAGFISLPGLVMLGVPADIAIATNKLADLGRFVFASIKFVRSKKVVWKLVLSLAPLAFIGGSIGASVVLEIDRDLLRRLMGIVILCLVPLGFINKSFGVLSSTVSRFKMVIGHLVYFLISLYGGSLQVGSGPMLLYAVVYFFGLTIIQANATSSFCWLFLTISSLFTFISRGVINWPVGIAMMIGSSIGGHLGAHVAVAKGDLWTKRFLAVVICLMAVKLVFFS